MTDTLSPTPIFKAFDNNGNPLAGGLLYTYAAGTSTPQVTYSDAAGTPNQNPITLNFRGECSLWLDTSLSYKLQLTDSLGNTIPGYPVDNVNGAGLIDYSLIPSIDNTFTLGSPSSSWANIYLGPNHANAFDPATGNILYYETFIGETNNAITPTNKSYYYGDLRRYGGVADSATDCTVPLQNALTSCAGYYPVRIPANDGSTCQVSARVTAPAGTHIIMEEGSILNWISTTANGTNLLGSATRPGIEATGDDFLIEGKGTLYGPSTATYVGNECALLRIGTSAANRGTGFIVRDIEVTNWGSYGVVLQFMEGIECLDMINHDNGFSGFTFYSCQRGRVQRNKIYSMTPGVAANMYGLNCTHDSTNYSSDPNVTAAPRQTVNPFCIDFDVSFNEVYGINWEGLDAHGGYELNYHDNKVYDCYIGIQISGSSGAASAYAGENNKVCHNAIYASQINGDASTTSGHSGKQFGITVNGGATLTNRAIVVIGNTIVGCGDTSGSGASAFSIQCTNVEDAVILGNVIRDWYSVGIYGAVFDGTISNNMLNAPLNATLSKCIWVDSNSFKSTINGNRLEIHGGNAPAEGLRISNSGSLRPVAAGNTFIDATTPYSGDAALFTGGMSDVPPRIQDATTGSHTATINVLGYAPIVYYQYTGAGVATLTSLTGGSPGQIVVIYNSSSSTLTVSDSGSTIKLTGGTAAVAQFGTLTLQCVATTGNPQFVEMGRSLTNT